MASVGIGNNGRYDASLNLDYHKISGLSMYFITSMLPKIRLLDMWTEPQPIVVL
jgi:hypothetical protein